MWTYEIDAKKGATIYRHGIPKYTLSVCDSDMMTDDDERLETIVDALNALEQKPSKV